MEINEYLEHKENDTPNIMLVKKLYRAISPNESDKSAVKEILTDNPTWNVCPGCPEGGTYHGLHEVFGVFYRKLYENYFKILMAEPEVFVDGGNIVMVLGLYSFKALDSDIIRRARFSHTWKITPDNRIDGVWQVCDSFEMRELLKAE